MILFPLKNRRLCLQLFLGLLLAIGTLPKGSEGLKCYNCRPGSGPEGPCLNDESKTCAAEEVCAVRDTPGEGVDQDCAPKKNADCIKAAVPVEEGENRNGDCLSFRLKKESMNDLAKAFADCNAPATLGTLADVTKLPAGELATVCFCDTDSCNSHSILPVIEPPPEDSRTGDGLKPSSELILALLTAAGVYTCLRGPFSV